MHRGQDSEVLYVEIYAHFNVAGRILERNKGNREGSTEERAEESLRGQKFRLGVWTACLHHPETRLGPHLLYIP